MPEPDRPVQINISGIPVAGVGGLGLVAMAVLVSIVMPAAWWLMVAGMTGGCVLGALLVVARRHSRPHGPSGDDPAILFRSLPDEPVGHTAKRNTAAHDRELLTADC